MVVGWRVMEGHHRTYCNHLECEINLFAWLGTHCAWFGLVDVVDDWLGGDDQVSIVVVIASARFAESQEHHHHSRVHFVGKEVILFVDLVRLVNCEPRRFTVSISRKLC